MEESIVAFDLRIEDAIMLFCDIVERLNEVPALGRIAIQTVIAAIGIDMWPFPTASHLSWQDWFPPMRAPANDARRAFRMEPLTQARACASSLGSAA